MRDLSSFAAFKARASAGSYFPFVKKIDGFENPSALYRRWADFKSPSVLLESARVSSGTGRYSIIAKDPFLVFESKAGRVRLSAYGAAECFETDPLEKLKELLSRYSSPSGIFLPFTGGAVGYFGYEVKSLIEPRLPRKARDDLQLPDIYLLFFDEGVVVDHKDSCIFLFSNVRVGRDLGRSYEEGLKKIHAFEARFRSQTARPRRRPAAGRGNAGVHRALGIQSNLTRRNFIGKVMKIKDSIRKGDIFQANLSQRFSFPVKGSAFRIYEKLKTMNPSPFFGYLDALRFQIVSGSPERLVKLENGLMETRPIAGTRSRGKNPLEDRWLSRDLLLDEKERAEHIMLVDLERNDMGRVAEYGTVGANELMVVEDYSHVKHIVSNIRGVLREKLSAVDVLRAFFPGGTITGAPKIRCMEILDALEPVTRGPYTGSLGYLGFNGNMDLNIIIRSLVVKDKKAYLQVGAGIVADSVPGKEYDETLYKAEAVLKAVFGEQRIDAFFAGCRAQSPVS